MEKNEKTPLNIDGIEYNFEDLNDDQKMIINHLSDLDRKIGSARFNLDQLQFGRNAFFNLLKQTLENTTVKEGEVAQ